MFSAVGTSWFQAVWLRIGCHGWPFKCSHMDIVKRNHTHEVENIFIHSFKVGRVGDEELFDVIQFTHSFQLEAQAKKECRSV